MSGIAASRTTSSIDRAWAIVFSRVRRYASSIARIIAPGIVREGMIRARISSTTPAAMSAPPTTTSPSEGRLNPTRQRDAAEDDADDAAPRPASAGPGRRLA